MTDATQPLTPENCNLQDFAFMPLDVARLRDSDLAASETPEACWAAVQLWAAAWHQVPAASIPDDDKWLAQQTGYGRIVKEWMKVRGGALRGWIKCTDGRLYHPVVAEKAIEAWQAKLAQRWRTECARIKKHNERHHTAIQKPEYEEWLSSGCPQGHPLHVPSDKAASPKEVTDETSSKRKGEGQGQGDSSSVPDGTGADAPKSPADMTKDELWKVGKSLLAGQGTPVKQCGAIVGKLCKDYGDEVVISAIRTAVVERPADALTFIKAICMRHTGQRQTPNKQEALEASNNAVAARFLEGLNHAPK